MTGDEPAMSTDGVAFSQAISNMHTTLDLNPTSCSCSTSMICSSENPLQVISLPSNRSGCQQAVDEKLMARLRTTQRAMSGREAGVPSHAYPRHACKYRAHMRGHAVGEISADLVGSERVRRHPHRRARSAPQCGVSCGPRACRVRVPISSGRPSYSASGGGAEAISVMAWNSAKNSGRCCIRYRTIRAFPSSFPRYPLITVN